MMKLNKNQFKKILKECILELVKEGAFDKVISESLHSSNHVQSRSGVDLRENTNQAQPLGLGQMTPNQRLKEVARMTAMGAANGDKKQAEMLASIFEDTAMTTLQSQLNEGGGGGAMSLEENNMPAITEHEQAQLELLSGGHGMKHWAALAFGTAGKK